jgi:hypothetical protein
MKSFQELILELDRLDIDNICKIRGKYILEYLMEYKCPYIPRLDILLGGGVCFIWDSGPCIFNYELKNNDSKWNMDKEMNALSNLIIGFGVME